MTYPRPKELILCELADASKYGVESWSPFCLKAHRALRAAGLSYERRHGRMPSSLPKGEPGRGPGAGSPGGRLEPVADSDPESFTSIEKIAGPIGGELDPRTRAEAWLWEEARGRAAQRLPGRRPLGRRPKLAEGPAGVLGACPWFSSRRSSRRSFARRVVNVARRGATCGVAGRRRAGSDSLTTLEDLEARGATGNGFWMGERSDRGRYQRSSPSSNRCERRSRSGTVACDRSERSPSRGWLPIASTRSPATRRRPRAGRRAGPSSRRRLIAPGVGRAVTARPRNPGVSLEIAGASSTASSSP